jgi:hypothetical protein
MLGTSYKKAIPSIAEAIRAELNAILEGKKRGCRMALEGALSRPREASAEATKQERASKQVGTPNLATTVSGDQAGAGPGTMTHELNWEHLSDDLERLKAIEPLRAQWYAYEGSEDYGIWLLRPGGRRTGQIRATFTLTAAQIIEKLQIQPIPIPEATQHCPHWADYCSVEEDLARRAGQKLNLSGAVPYGLDTIDRDAVDPCTRAFLEVLRREGLAFKIKANGTSVVKGQTYSSVTGTIDDVLGAAAAYCKRRARDEIGALLRKRLENEVTLSSNDSRSSHSPSSMLDPFQDDAGGRPLGSNPFPASHAAYEDFEEATWRATKALNRLRSELLETLSKPPFDFIQSDGDEDAA